MKKKVKKKPMKTPAKKEKMENMPMYKKGGKKC